MECTEVNLGEDYCITYNILSLVFSLLKPPDLLRCSEVCKLWKQIAMDPIFWRSVTLEKCQLNFELMSNVLEDFQTTHLKLKDCLFVLNTTDMFNALKKITSLRKLELSECSSNLIEKLSEANPNLEVIKTNIICGIIGLKLDLNFVKEMPNITELRLYCNREIDSSINCLQSLRRLQHLYLLGVKQLWLLNLKDCNLGQSTQLQSLGLGDCWNLPKNFGDFLKTLTTLKKLRLEMCKNCHIANILESISSLKKLKCLELIEINVDNGFEQSLRLCTNIAKLTIVPNPTRLQMALFNTKIVAGVITLKHSLKQYIWGFIPRYLEYTEKIAGHKNVVPLLLPLNSELCCTSTECVFLSLNHLQSLISEKMTQTKVIVECKEYTGNVFFLQTLY